MPIILGNDRAVFLHIQKTGGTWVRHALMGGGVPVECIPKLSGQWDYGTSAHIAPGAPRFAVVRNPYRWYASFWAQHDRVGWGGDLSIGHCGEFPVFSDFIRAAVEQLPGFLFHLYNRYDPEDADVSILQVESLADDLVRFLRQKRIDFDEQGLRAVPRRNVIAKSSEYGQKVQYTRELAHLLWRSEKETFTKYGYRKNSYRGQERSHDRDGSL